MSPISASGGIAAASLAQFRQELQMQQSVPGAGINDPILAPGFPSVAPANQTPAVFDNMLGNFVNEVNNKHVAAGDAITGMLSGENVPLHKTMIAFEEASVSFKLMLEVRNKLLEGYQELLRMQV